MQIPDLTRKYFDRLRIARAQEEAKEARTANAKFTSASHTPGPWTIDHESIRSVSSGDIVALLCDVTATKLSTVVDWPRSTTSEHDDKENCANAEVIALAPALLRVAQLLGQAFISSEDSEYADLLDQAIGEAREALDKTEHFRWGEGEY